MRRLLPSLACLLLAITACGGGGDAGGGGSGEQDPIKIGLIVSLTGNYTPLGSEDKKAVELAVEQVNQQGGLLGRKVELITRDDKTAPDQGIVAYKQIKGEIDALIGPVFSNSALAIEPWAERDKIPYLSLAPAQEQVEPIKSYIFVTPALSSMYAERFLQYMQAEGIKTIAVAWDSKSAYSVAGHKAMVELAPQYGVTIAVDESYETTTSDFSPMFTHVRDSEAEALVFWGSGAPGVTAVTRLISSITRLPSRVTSARCLAGLSAPALNPSSERICSSVRICPNWRLMRP